MVAFPSRPRIAYGDVAAIAETVRPIITPWYKGRIYIFTPPDSAAGINIDAGTMELAITPYWNGPARIQPTRNYLLSKETTNDTRVREVLFQCGYAKDGTLPDVRPGDQIIVANGGNNQLLTQYQYVIAGTLNSSVAWNHTIRATTNMEAVPHYQFDTAVWPDEDIFPGENLFPSF